MEKLMGKPLVITPRGGDSRVVGWLLNYVNKSNIG